ncbi:MAG: hypothetical protein IT292_09330 [Deltaproteobacteria bacterium]|nr:hypothetical protein [Deltaproteobacteria bacterium]
MHGAINKAKWLEYVLPRKTPEGGLWCLIGPDSHGVISPIILGLDGIHIGIFFLPRQGESERNRQLSILFRETNIGKYRCWPEFFGPEEAGEILLAMNRANVFPIRGNAPFLELLQDEVDTSPPFTAQPFEDSPYIQIH